MSKSHRHERMFAAIGAIRRILRRVCRDGVTDEARAALMPPLKLLESQDHDLSVGEWVFALWVVSAAHRDRGAADLITRVVPAAEKVDLLARRAERGEPLFVEGDAPPLEALADHCSPAHFAYGRR